MHQSQCQIVTRIIKHRLTIWTEVTFLSQVLQTDMYTYLPETCVGKRVNITVTVIHNKG